ncbi:MAG: putative transcriptional regulator [Verrucomicrobiaceae bacterium]|nr:putative transcriptional regulator [Verrucomicrobiaceae bacterium]
MQRSTLNDVTCPIARALNRVGEWWSTLILRDTLNGFSRFDEIQKSLGIAPNMLTRRLNDLVAEELLERRQYCEKPPRFEYIPTERGRDFMPVIVALLAWGNKHFTPEGENLLLVDRETGKAINPILVDANSGKPITPSNHTLSAGPAACEEMQKRIAFITAKREDPSLRPTFLFETPLDRTTLAKTTAASNPARQSPHAVEK